MNFELELTQNFTFEIYNIDFYCLCQQKWKIQKLYRILYFRFQGIQIQSPIPSLLNKLNSYAFLSLIPYLFFNWINTLPLCIFLSFHHSLKQDIKYWESTHIKSKQVLKRSISANYLHMESTPYIKILKVFHLRRTK